MLGADPTRTISENYRRFARLEVHGKSPLYEELCEAIADDARMLAFLSEQPPAKRQPNLLLAAVRVFYGTARDYREFRSAVLEHRDEVAAVLRARRTQTNEPGRCSVLLPLLNQLPQPIALLEVGTAAGLCLLFDRYGYDYDGRRVGGDEVVFECSTHGQVPIPAAYRRSRGAPGSTLSRSTLTIQTPCHGLRRWSGRRRRIASTASDSRSRSPGASGPSLSAGTYSTS